MGNLIWEDFPGEIWISYFQRENEKYKFIILKKCDYHLLIQRIQERKVMCTMHPEPQTSLTRCKDQAELYIQRLLDRS